MKLQVSLSPHSKGELVQPLLNLDPPLDNVCYNVRVALTLDLDMDRRKGMKEIYLIVA